METKIKMGREEITVKENMVDRVVRYFSPEMGQKRLKARSMTAVAGNYSGASRDRRSLKGWTTLGNDADTDLLADLPTLRERSRDLVRNAPIATGAINTVVTSVVGPGLKLKSEIDGEVLGLSDDEARKWEREAERLFSFFANSRDCDITRTQTFYEKQDLTFRSALENGDAFTLLPIGETKGFPFGLRIQTIEADRVENENFVTDTAMLAGGVEMDSNGAPVSYHILKMHPGGAFGGSREWQKVSAFGSKTGRRNVLHHFRRTRPGQSRGVPYLAPVIESLKQIDRYSDAEIMAAVVSGMFTVFVKSEGDTDLDVFEPSGETGGSATDDDYKLGNGAIVQMGEGDSIESANPGRPNAEFDPFVLAIMRQVGMALEVPYEVLIKHFTASYSAARASLLEAWRFFSARRVWLASSFCQPVYEAFIDEQVAAGRLHAPGYFSDPIIRAAYLGSQWVGRPQGQIDPLKENKADVIAEDRGWKTAAQNTIEKTGGDWERNHKQRSKEVAMRREDGLDAEIVVETQPVETAADVKNAASAYHSGVESGAITPQVNDEAHFRAKLGMPVMSDTSSEAWVKAGGIRLPVIAKHEASDIIVNTPNVRVDNHIPEPIVNVTAEAKPADVVVNTPEVTVHNKMDAPVVNVAASDTKAPDVIVNVENIVEPAEVHVENKVDVPSVTVEVPTKDRAVSIKRNAKGELEGTITDD